MRWIRHRLSTCLEVGVEPLGGEDDSAVLQRHDGTVGQEGGVPARQHLQPVLRHNNLPKRERKESFTPPQRRIQLLTLGNELNADPDS